MRRVKPKKDAPKARYPLFARWAAWLWPAGVAAAGAAHADTSLPTVKRGNKEANGVTSIPVGRRNFADLIEPKQRVERGQRLPVQKVIKFPEIVVTGGVVAQVVPVDATPPPPPKPPKPEDKKPCPVPPSPKPGDKRPFPPLGGKVAMPEPPQPLLHPEEVKLPPKDERELPPLPQHPPPPAKVDIDQEDPFPDVVWLHPHGVDEPCSSDNRLVTIRVPRRAKEA